MERAGPPDVRGVERKGVNTAPTILVVDDERNIVELVQLYLRSEGYQVEVAYDGREALDKVATLHPDLVVLDLMMPELDGWEVTRRLRRDGGKTPVIMLTAKGDEVDRVIGLEMGADDYLPKPFGSRELVAPGMAISFLNHWNNGASSELTPTEKTTGSPRFTV